MAQDTRGERLPKASRRAPRKAAGAVLGVLALAALGAGSCAPGYSAAAALGEGGEGSARGDGLFLNWIDRSVAPSSDFFRFANGNWLKTNPIPPDRSYWGVDAILDQQNQSFIRSLIERLEGESRPDGSEQRKVADFYASGMDEQAIEAAGAAPLGAELERIASIPDAGALPEAANAPVANGMGGMLGSQPAKPRRGAPTGLRTDSFESLKPAAFVLRNIDIALGIHGGANGIEELAREEKPGAAADR